MIDTRDSFAIRHGWQCGFRKGMGRMTAKFTIIVAAMGIISAAQSSAVTFTFLENGNNLDLGPSSTFIEGAFSLTASGFLTSGGTTDLYAKSEPEIGGSSEIGLGTTSDPTGDHEITADNFIQLTLPTIPPSNVLQVFLGSVQAGESAEVFFTQTAGTLSGATLIGTVSNADGSVTVPAGDQTGFVDITAGQANVLLTGVIITAAVPEPSVMSFLPVGGILVLFLSRFRSKA